MVLVFKDEVFVFLATILISISLHIVNKAHFITMNSKQCVFISLTKLLIHIKWHNALECVKTSQQVYNLQCAFIRQQAVYRNVCAHLYVQKAHIDTMIELQKTKSNKLTTKILNS